MADGPRYSRRDFVRTGLKGLAGLASDAKDTEATPYEPPVMAAVAPVPSGSDEISAYIARPEQPGSYSAILLVHEISGLNGQIKEVACRFAREGYVAIVPDLLSRESDPRLKYDLKARRDALESTPEEQILQDLEASLEHLALLTFVDHHCLAAVGFGMGGSLVFRLASKTRSLRAAVDFYGYDLNPPEDKSMVAACMKAVPGVSCPILGIFAESDDRISIDDATALKDELLKHRRPFQIKIYPDAPHAFFNEDGGNYHRQMAEDAWKRMGSFLHKYLR